MKNNLISAIAGWKSAALLALVAMVAAVAFSGVLSTSQTADAAVRDAADPTGAALTGADLTKNNGDTVYISNTDGSAAVYVRFTIETTGAAKASFTHSSATNNGQTILCNGGGACDAHAASADSVEVALKIADDSGAGAIFVRQATVAATPANALDTITVVVAQVPTKISVKPSMKSIDSGQTAIGNAGSSLIDIQLTDANGKGIAGKRLLVVATRGVLSEVTTTDGENARTIGGATGDELTFTATAGTLPDSTLAQAGSVITTADADATAGTPADAIDSAGYARVKLTGAGSPGVATITVTVGGVTGTASVVLHGSTAKIDAKAEQSAIEAGGKTFIVVTATDSAGNPVANHNVALKTPPGVVGPSKAGTKVVVSNTVNKDAGTVGSLLDPGDLPACGDVTAVTATPDTDPPVVGVAGSTGTNGDGKCVIQVDAGSATGPADDAARGTHTITLGGPKPDGSTDVTLEIEVGGPPDSIMHDADERIDPSDEITVNLTVIDDMGVRVGRVAIEVLKTAGDGAIITEVGAMTSDGRAKFTYLAPSTPGTVEFLARTKDATGKVTAKVPIIVHIGPEPVVEEEPEGPPPTWHKMLFSGQNLVSWQGEDGADPSAGATEGVVAIWAYNTASGSWEGFFPNAADVPGGNTLTSLTHGDAYFVIVE